MKHAEEDTRVPDLLLERLRLGELPAAEAAALRARIDADTGLRARLAELDDSDARLAASGRLEALLARLGKPAAAGGSPRRWSLGRWAVLAAALTGVALLAPRALGRRPADEAGVDAPRAASETRVKGLEPALTVFRKTDTGSEPLTDGDLARPGDLVRVAYSAAGRPYGAIVSVDGRGAVTLHLPRNGAQAAPLQPGPAVLLEEAYQLDDAPRFERFFFVTAAAPFAVSAVMDAARTAATRASPPAALPLPAGLQQSAVTLLKGAAR